MCWKTTSVKTVRIPAVRLHALLHGHVLETTMQAMLTLAAGSQLTEAMRFEVM